MHNSNINYKKIALFLFLFAIIVIVIGVFQLYKNDSKTIMDGILVNANKMVYG